MLDVLLIKYLHANKILGCSISQLQMVGRGEKKGKERSRKHLKAVKW